MNQKVFFLINSPAGGNIILDQIGIFVAESLIFVIFFLTVLFLVWSNYAVRRKLVKNFVILGVMIILTVAVDGLINIFLPTDRPFVANSVKLLISHGAGSSFPSLHTALSAAAATIIWFNNRIVGYVFFLLALLVGWGRIFVGVHWPADILGGLALGIAAFIISVRLMVRLTQDQL